MTSGYGEIGRECASGGVFPKIVGCVQNRIPVRKPLYAAD